MDTDRICAASTLGDLKGVHIVDSGHRMEERGD
jgi:hypothetical protein